jgi:hypothetical protein
VNIIDILMTGLFILFLFFILNGYHQTKLKERDEQEVSKKQDS